MKPSAYLPLALCAAALLQPAGNAQAAWLHRSALSQFISSMAHRYGFNRVQLTHIFQHVSVLKPVGGHSRGGPMNWPRYRSFFIFPGQVSKGAHIWRQQRSTLAHASQAYGVPDYILMGILGVESAYGGNTGKFRAIDALYTYAFHVQRRAHYFRNELSNYLLLARERHVSPFTWKSSYAGALGLVQFMPSSYRQYAVGRKDLWRTPDALASAANFLHAHGWQRGGPVAMPVHLRMSRHGAGHAVGRWASLRQWQAQGVAVPKGLNPGTRAKLTALPGDPTSTYWLTFHNFEVLKRYNPDTRYAMVVYQLGQAVRRGH